MNRTAAFCLPSSLFLFPAFPCSSVNERHSFATRHCVFSSGASNCHLGAGRQGGSTPLNCCQASQLAPSLITSPEGTSSFFSLLFFSHPSHSLPPSCFFYFFILQMTAVFTGKAVMLIRKVRLLLTDSLTSNLCSKHLAHKWLEV